MRLFKKIALLLISISLISSPITFPNIFLNYVQNNFNNSELLSKWGISYAIAATLLNIGPGYVTGEVSNSLLTAITTPILLGILSSSNRSNYIGVPLSSAAVGLTLGYFWYSKLIFHSNSFTYCSSNTGVAAMLAAGIHLACLVDRKWGAIVAGLGTFLSLSLRTRNDWEQYNPTLPSKDAAWDELPYIDSSHMVVPKIKEFLESIKDINKRENCVLGPVKMLIYLAHRVSNNRTVGHRLIFKDWWHTQERFNQEISLLQKVQNTMTTYKILCKRPSELSKNLIENKNYLEAMTKELSLLNLENTLGEIYKTEKFFYDSKIFQQDDEHELLGSHALLYNYLRRFEILKDTTTNIYKIVSGDVSSSLPIELTKYIDAFIFLDNNRRFEFLYRLQQLNSTDVFCPGTYKFLWYSGLRYSVMFWNQEHQRILDYKQIIINKKSLAHHKNHAHHTNCLFCTQYWTDEDTQEINEMIEKQKSEIQKTNEDDSL